ncbi:MAG: hypothetical protein CMC74_04495 [Flavobacteriaceae bacterium]|nr:hypothetical protein [Flavobacteriaceae bacterium]|tara:strand:+ start:35595 stop:35828 length:234 start_codon:yes stop_codon:yes gene_type:complete
MKYILLIFAVATFSLTSCKDGAKNEVETNTEEVAMTHYQCPMKCEGDKTYTDKDAKCGVCGMALKEVKTESESDHSH